MNKQNIIDNWDNYYKSYSRLNPDLVINGITSKRALLNHYVKYGYIEGRKINDDHIIVVDKPILEEKFENKIYILEERMIIEKLSN